VKAVLKALAEAYPVAAATSSTDRSPRFSASRATAIRQFST
jgi:hypothetical protein